LITKKPGLVTGFFLLTILLQKFPDEMADFPRGAGVHALAQVHKALPLVFFDTDNQLTVFLVPGFSGFGHGRQV